MKRKTVEANIATDSVLPTDTERQIHDEFLRRGQQLCIQVEFKNGMWWEMPSDLSSILLAQMRDGYHEVSFVWDWEETRSGAHVTPEGENTSFNRYILNFTTMQQINIDNNRTRRIKIVSIVKGAATDYAAQTATDLLQSIVFSQGLGIKCPPLT